MLWLAFSPDDGNAVGGGDWKKPLYRLAIQKQYQTYQYQMFPSHSILGLGRQRWLQCAELWGRL